MVEMFGKCDTSTALDIVDIDIQIIIADIM